MDFFIVVSFVFVGYISELVAASALKQRFNLKPGGSCPLGFAKQQKKWGALQNEYLVGGWTNPFEKY